MCSSPDVQQHSKTTSSWLRPQPIPLMARPSYRREFLAWSLLPVMMGALEGGVVGTIATRAFVGVASQASIDLAVAIIIGAGASANLSSALWASLASGRNKVRALVLLQIATAPMRCRACNFAHIQQWIAHAHGLGGPCARLLVRRGNHTHKCVGGELDQRCPSAYHRPHHGDVSHRCRCDRIIVWGCTRRQSRGLPMALSIGRAGGSCWRSGVWSNQSARACSTSAK